MTYIVYRKPFSSYGRPQGDGYFVKWKNKNEDEFSPNWFDAGKYKSLIGAISRLSIYGLESQSIEDFIKVNCDDLAILRDYKLAKITNQDFDITSIFYSKGRIDKIGDNGEFLGDVTNEAVDLILNNINKKSKRVKKQIDSSFFKTSTIVDCKEGEDFWEGY